MKTELSDEEVKLAEEIIKLFGMWHTALTIYAQEGKLFRITKEDSYKKSK